MSANRYELRCVCGSVWPDMKPEWIARAVEGHQTVCKVRTGAERYFAERKQDPEYAEAYAQASADNQERDG